MRKFQVVWTEMALKAIESIVSGFTDVNPAQIQRILDGIIDAGDSLENFPLRGRAVPELRNLGEADLREIFFKPWRLIYEIFSDRVEILLVLDGRRDCEELLTALLLNR